MGRRRLIWLVVVVLVLTWALWATAVVPTASAAQPGLTPIQQLTPATDQSSQPSMDSEGDQVHVVYRSGNDIVHRRSDDGGDTWTTEERLSHRYGFAGLPEVAVEGTAVHVVWRARGVTELGQIYYRHSTDGGDTWSRIQRLSRGDAASWAPSIAVRGGDVHVVWGSWNTGEPQIHYRRSGDGGQTWERPRRLTFGEGFKWDPSVVAASDGSVHVVWSGYYEILYRRCLDGGTLWGPISMLDDEALSQRLPEIVVSGDSLHVVWQKADGVNTVAYLRSPDLGETWSQTRRLNRSSIACIGMTVAARDGVVYVAWVAGQYDGRPVYYRASADDGVTWARVWRLNPAIGRSHNPTLSIAGDSVHFVWENNRADIAVGLADIFYRRLQD